MAAALDTFVELDRPPVLRRLRLAPPVFAVAPPVWRRSGRFSQAQASAELVRYAAEALHGHGLELYGGPMLLRHASGDAGLPSLPSQSGFALDLTDARRTSDGGLLLFVRADGRVFGWRAQAGALTIWSSPGPELTELAPGAPMRLTLVGSVRPV